MLKKNQRKVSRVLSVALLKSLLETLCLHLWARLLFSLPAYWRADRCPRARLESRPSLLAPAAAIERRLSEKWRTWVVKYMKFRTQTLWETVWAAREAIFERLKACCCNRVSRSHCSGGSMCCGGAHWKLKFTTYCLFCFDHLSSILSGFVQRSPLHFSWTLSDWFWA